MNKTVIALLLLGLVVAAMAGDAAKSKLDKMRMKKEKVMAKKDRLHHEKMRMKLPVGEATKRGQEKERVMSAYEELRKQADSGAISTEQFKEQVRRLKDEARRARAGTMSERKEAARKEAKEGTRNKRSIKADKMMKKAQKLKSQDKKRRSPEV